jgi:tetratricopeptide (TPR) repeat protein
LLGESDAETSADEIAWAFRKLVEEQAPLVCVFDDIQWGEETFLDLIEHLALFAGAPVLLLCLARPDLADRRPDWESTIRLAPLAEVEVAELIPASLESDVREKIARAAGGNPLFVTQMVAVAGETEGEVIVPPTLQAVLAARLDQLENTDRSVLERGAVEGEIFHRRAVQALSGSVELTPRLASLVRKELVRPDKAILLGDDAFRFRHLLIRDAAYEALPKATRADLHERFADWLEEQGQSLVELDEVLGHHLEQAAYYKAELGQSDPALVERAAERLAAAGRRALWRADERAAAPLLARALDLTRPLRFDVQLELDLADAQPSPQAAARIADAAAERALVLGDRAAEVVARVVAGENRLAFAPDAPIDELEAAAKAVLPLLEAGEDHAALARVWFALGEVASMRGRYEEWGRTREQQLRHSRLAGRGDPWRGLGGPLLYGPRPADEALRTLDDVYRDAPHPLVMVQRAELLAMLGRFDEVWSIAQEASEQLGEIGQLDGTDRLAEIAALAGDYEAAEHYLGLHCEGLEARGDRGHLSTYAPARGRVLCMLGRYEEAEPLAQTGRELGDKKDASTQMVWRQVQALVHAHRGEHAEAERLAREAVEIAETTDGLNYQGDACCDLADVLAAAGRTEAAADALEQALDRYERKKNLAMVAQVRRQLEELRAQVS